eukprot:5732510-Karenia_brevis.AAC.1
MCIRDSLRMVTLRVDFGGVAVCVSCRASPFPRMLVLRVGLRAFPRMVVLRDRLKQDFPRMVVLR